MAFGGFHEGGKGKPMADINMIPLIDVMLVLLVIFIITAPLMTHAVKIDLPKAASHPNVTKVENVQLGINAANVIYWDGEVVDKAEMQRRMVAAAKLDPQPELHIRADKTTQYQVLAEVMAAASSAGLVKIGFVSDPNIAR
ncbi:MAG: biopolymer transporter ExbD [Rhodocyclaceae bacterium]|nr:MAG: biopolymer transporter ExbD [Rhodocyclaceae bacterium]